MKIAYENTVPEKELYFTFMQSEHKDHKYTAEKEQVYGALLQSWYVVAAYDKDELVGCGRMYFDSESLEPALIMDLIVLPGYRQRGMGTNIIKLLYAECKTRQIIGLREIGFFAADFEAVPVSCVNEEDKVKSQGLGGFHVDLGVKKRKYSEHK